MADPFTLSPEDILNQARQLSANARDDAAVVDRAHSGRRVRVLRAYVFEGPWEDVRDQLARSQADGSTRAFAGHQVTITCHQGLIENLGPVEVKKAPAADAYQNALAAIGLGDDTLLDVHGPNGPVTMRQLLDGLEAGEEWATLAAANLVAGIRRGRSVTL